MERESTRPRHYRHTTIPNLFAQVLLTATADSSVLALVLNGSSNTLIDLEREKKREKLEKLFGPASTLLTSFTHDDVDWDLLTTQTDASSDVVKTQKS